MDKVRNNFVIFYTIMGFANAEIDFNEFYSQVKKNAIYIKNLGYQVEKIENSDIYSFFKLYPITGKIYNGKIIINSKITSRQKEFFFRNVDKDLIAKMRENNKFVFPMIFEDKIITYCFISSNKCLNEIRNSFYYDSYKNKAYVIDLSVIEDKQILNNVISFLESFLSKVEHINKEIIDFKEIGRLFNLSYSIKNGEYNDVIQKFGLTDEFNKISSLYEILFYYNFAATNNDYSLRLESKNKILKK